MRNDSQVRRFTEQFLNVDGVFLLRLIAHNTSGITATEVAKELWDMWYERHLANSATTTTTTRTTDVDQFNDSTEIKRPLE